METQMEEILCRIAALEEKMSYVYNWIEEWEYIQFVERIYE